MSEQWSTFLVGVFVGGMLNFLVWAVLDTYDRRKKRATNPYRQGECSGNSSSQPTAETSNLLNKGEI